MFAINARVVPAAAPANVLRERGATCNVDPSTLTSTSVFTFSARLPFAPLIVTVCPCTSALTPLASSTGFLATLDIALLSTWCHSFRTALALEYDAQHFAAVPFSACLHVRH